jgi:hypothetical protein
MDQYLQYRALFRKLSRYVPEPTLANIARVSTTVIRNMIWNNSYRPTNRIMEKMCAEIKDFLDFCFLSIKHNPNAKSKDTDVKNVPFIING